MKILHTKATSAPILLVSACPGMNLLAVVTAAAATVYRSTTLTVVAALSLREEGTAAAAAEEGAHTGDTSLGAAGVRACWSPSGRVFTLALPSGVVLLLDVEEGVLVRRFEPATALARSTAAGVGDTTKPFAEDGAEGDGEDEQEVARRLSCQRLLQQPPSLPLSTAAGPVAVLQWVSAACTGAAMKSAHGAAADCLPLPSTVVNPLLDELVSSLSTRTGTAATKAAAPAGEGSTETSTVAFLVVMDAAGGVSLIAGGLQEVCFVHASAPTCAALDGGGGGVARATQDLSHTTWAGCVVDECVMTACAASMGESSPIAALAPALGFHTLTAESLAALAVAMDRAGGLAGSPPHRVDPCAATSAAVAGAVHHRAYLAVRRPHAAGHDLVDLSFGSTLHTLASDEVQVLCRVGELCRIAWCGLAHAVECWESVLRDRVLAHLSLPASAALLRDAVVETIALSDTHALEEYYRALDTAALAVDGERLSLTLSVLANDVYSICYRAYHLSHSLLVGLRRSGSAGGQRERFADADTSAGARAAAWVGLTEALAHRRRACEAFLLRIRREAAEATLLLHFVLQRASLLFTAAAELTGGREGSRAASAPRATAATTTAAAAASAVSYATEPLPTAQQPALLAALHRLLFDEDDDPSCSPAVLRAGQAELEGLLRLVWDDTARRDDAMAAPTSTAWPRPPLSCALVPTTDLTAIGDAGTVMWCGRVTAPPAHAAPAIRARLHALVVSRGPPFAAALLPPSTTIEAAAGSLCADAPSTVLVVGEKESLAPLQVGEEAGDTAVAALLPSSPRVVWYGCLDEDRHLVLFLSGEAAVSEGFSLAMFDDRGSIRARDLDDDDEEEAEEDAEDEEGGGGGGSRGAEEDSVPAATAAASSRYQIVEVRGMEMDAGSVMVSMSRAREFCVVAARNRFVVIDLYED